MSRKQGVVTARVEAVDAGQGRVRVRYEDIDEDLTSTWAYVASSMAGKSRGALFMPEIDDEVLVAFGDADFDYPYVLGFLWNGQQVSPDTNPNHRVIVTPGGHQLRFEDQEGANPGAGARVILQSNGGHSITMEDKPPPKLEIKSTQHSIVLDDTPGAGKVTVAANGGLVTVDLTTAPPGVTVSSGGNSIAMGPGGVTVTAVGPIALDAPVVTVNAGIATFAGVVQCQTLIANAVVSASYTPGAGNVI